MRWKSAAVGVTVRIVLVLLAIALIKRASTLEQDYRIVVTQTFSGTAGFWRWWLAGALVVIAGIAVGLAMRSTLPGRHFRADRAVAIGIVPFLLAIVWPLFVWGWPVTRLGSWFGWAYDFSLGVQAHVMWLIVGLGIAAGFDDGHRGQGSNDPATTA